MLISSMWYSYGAANKTVGHTLWPPERSSLDECECARADSGRAKLGTVELVGADVGADDFWVKFRTHLDRTRSRECDLGALGVSPQVPHIRGRLKLCVVPIYSNWWQLETR